MDMNSVVTFADPTAPPPLPPQPPRSSFSCDRHPDEQFSGFCPSCLCERLTVLDKSSSNTPSSSRRPSSVSAAATIKSLFSSSSSKPANVNFFPPPPHSKPSKPTSVLPQLRRTKSFSASKNESLGLSFEPQRKSCDVRGRNTLSSLFTLDDDDKTIPSASTSRNYAERSQNTKPYESYIANKHVLEEPENEESVKDPENIEVGFVDEEGDTDEITPALDSHLENLRSNSERNVIDSEMVGSYFLNMSNNVKLMKDNLDIGTREKKSSGRGFWAAASVFSKKWHNWRRKQKIKRQNNGENLPTLPVEKPISKQFRETQSEVADYGFGRRSCDTDPRFSLDAGRISFDDPRYSFDEPRASWDGHLLGRSFPRMVAPMVSLMEDSPATHVQRSDMQIPVEEPPSTLNCSTEDEVVPGGSAQTREYYLDSFSRRRKSLDRSSSMRKMEPSVATENDNKVLPAGVDYFHGPKILIGERDLRDSNSCSFRDDCSEFFELKSGLRDGDPVVGNAARKESKKTRRWSWRIWGLINRHGGRNKFGDEERYGGSNRVERSFSESWRELNREGNADGRGGLERKVFRSNSTVSWRNSNHFHHAPFGSFRKSSIENGYGNVLEKSKSGRFSLNRVDNEPLRIYLPPMRSGRRGGMNLNPNNSHSIARSVLRLY
ncbi:protein OCTOPUS-like [Primulina huaijiensis]|uniref:protein OCTOPUS-like n=1 Tax=Primulina huaijiensis TaxID=1492673 RepID=UPI003CC6E612